MMTPRSPLWLTASLTTAAVAATLLACSEVEGNAQAQARRQDIRSNPPTGLPAQAAAMVQRFERASYKTVLWVSANAKPGGDGSTRQPFDTINGALLRARPCTEVRVLTGVYRENVRFERNLDGAPDCPIRLVSFDGIGKAQVVAPDPARTALGGGGSENIVVEGFSISGGKNGIQFGQNGNDWTDLARNIMVRFNVIQDPVDDGIKINGAETVVIAHNSTKGGTDESIDLFGTIDAAIVRNRIGSIQTRSGALTIKAGSRSILVSGNSVSGVSTHGIVVGGRTGRMLIPRPGFESFEADAVRIFGNRVENLGKVPLAFLGARNSQAWNNQLVAGPGASSVMVSNNLPDKGSRLIVSSGIRGWNNYFAPAAKTVQVQSGSTDIWFEDKSAPRMPIPTGPDTTAFKP